jgi:hypothetical protein
MKKLILAALCVATLNANAEIKIVIAHNSDEDATAGFNFDTVPSPSTNHLARNASFRLIDGTVDENSGGLDKLHDGQWPDEADQPDDNFFLAAGSSSGRLVVDLGHAADIRQINTYSRHTGTRAPHVYKLYASTGEGTNFDSAPKAGIAPESCGWKLVGSVDTRTKFGGDGGQYGVSITSTENEMAQTRYLLFDLAVTEQDDDFGNTFYSEIDVRDTPGTPAKAPGHENEFSFQTADGKCTITINTAKAPELKEWAQTKLEPALTEWYPKITAELPSDGYTAPDHFKVTLKPMDGVAYTAGKNVTANSEWLEKELNGEAVGALIHEAVHVVQQYPGDRKIPGWMVEGIPDYIRWFQFDADKHGADAVWMHKRGKNFSPHYYDSYRVTANFLDWVSRKYDKDIVREMNAAMRGHKYDESLWKKYTGKTLSDLGDEWRKECLSPG